MQIKRSEVKEIVREVVKEIGIDEKYTGFKNLEKKLAGQKGVKDPGALAASIGRKKYGKKKFQNAAAKGKSLKGASPKSEASVEEIAAKDKSNPSGKLSCVCQECGKKFKTSSFDPHCPKCGGRDIDIG